MCQLDPETGKELKTVDITAAMGELKAMFFNGMAVDTLLGLSSRTSPQDSSRWGSSSPGIMP